MTVKGRPSLSRQTLVLVMFAVIGLVTALGVWDANREFDSVLDHLAIEQHFLAVAIARDVSSRLALLEENERLQDPSVDPALLRSDALDRVLDHLKMFEENSDVMVLLHVPGRTGFHAADGRVIAGSVLTRAIEAGQSSLVLDRRSATELGYPPRRAVAGFAAARGNETLPEIEVAVLSGATQDRTRRSHAAWRVAFVVVIVSAAVLGFGGLLLVHQRRELRLAAELARAGLEAERDEHLARADRFAALAALSTGVGHELSTPLTVVLARLEQLANALGGNERAERALKAIETQVERMRAIIRGFLALARGDAPTLERASALRLVSDAEELVRHRFSRANVELVSEVASDVPDVTCDPPLFVQVLVNLLVNACHASRPSDTVRLRVSSDDAVVRFEVEDEGEGIHRDVADKIKAPFFTTRADAGGTGLGLAIANEIVQQHSGSLEIVPRVEVADEASQGTLAIVRLPLARPEAARTEGQMTRLGARGGSP